MYSVYAAEELLKYPSQSVLDQIVKAMPRWSYEATNVFLGFAASDIESHGSKRSIGLVRTLLDLYKADSLTSEVPLAATSNVDSAAVIVAYNNDANDSDLIRSLLIKDPSHPGFWLAESQFGLTDGDLKRTASTLISDSKTDRLARIAAAIALSAQDESLISTVTHEIDAILDRYDHVNDITLLQRDSRVSKTQTAITLFNDLQVINMLYFFKAAESQRLVAKSMASMNPFIRAIGTRVAAMRFPGVLLRELPSTLSKSTRIHFMALLLIYHPEYRDQVLGLERPDELDKAINEMQTSQILGLFF
jgi:hypothetical protein